MGFAGNVGNVGNIGAELRFGKNRRENQDL
jgi:hypothetical protein